MEKRQRRGLPLSSPSRLSYALMCALRPLAAAERQERSD